MKCKKHSKEIEMLQVKSLNVPIGYVCLFCMSFIPEINSIHLDVLKSFIKRQMTTQ
jgi:hypothetical protein